MDEEGLYRKSDQVESVCYYNRLKIYTKLPVNGMEVEAWQVVSQHDTFMQLPNPLSDSVITCIDDGILKYQTNHGQPSWNMPHEVTF